MSVSKVLWSNSEVSKNTKVKNAKFLNDSSMLSLKCQAIFFVFIITEICFNVLFQIFGVESSLLYQYMLICKTALTINVIFIICYIYQIIHSKISIYLCTLDNENQTLIKSIIFDIWPEMKNYYERLINSKWLYHWFQKEAIEKKRIQAKLDEDRRKSLCKMDFPSMNSALDDSLYMFKPGNLNLIKTSTPYSKRNLNTPLADNFVMTHSPINFCHNIAVGGTALPGLQKNYHSPQSPNPSNQSPFSGYNINRHQFEAPLEVSSSDVWRRLDIDMKDLNQLITSMKTWFHLTIITRLVDEIDKLNGLFVQLGLPGVVIGETSLQQLRQLSGQYSVQFPSLAMLINFLDGCNDQGYLVNRIRELSSGTCLGQYRWDSGSTSATQPWRDHLPNDTMLLLHFLSTYIDSKLAYNVCGQRTFNEQFIIDYSMAVDIKDRCALLLVSVQPPRLKVAVKRTIYDVGEGRLNMIKSLLVFFHAVHRDDGTLKWLNLGRAGINLKWLFDQHQ